MTVPRFVVSVSLCLLAGGVPGCILGNRPALVQLGSRNDQITYYLDGAGNYGFGKETVPLGLADGGYQGHLQHYIWTTYLGAVADQVSVNHNRREGRQLATRIERYLDTYRDGEVNLIGLSAGTGVVVFALEALNPKCKVQNVVMLSSSLSADYDLTTALRRVQGGIHFFWSPDDPILADVVPIVGTVDRSSRSTPPAGMWGARLPFGASEATRDLYAKKVRNIRWYTEPVIGPIKLRHAGSVSRSLIRERVAPILVHGSRFAKPPEPAGTPDSAVRPRESSGTSGKRSGPDAAPSTISSERQIARTTASTAQLKPLPASPSAAGGEQALMAREPTTTAPAKSGSTTPSTPVAP